MRLWLHVNQFIHGREGRLIMPVYLDEVPDEAPRIKRPGTKKWLVYLAFFIVIGCVLSFWLWTSSREGLVFWLTALGLPFCLWGLFAGLRRCSYKADQVWAESWNEERARLLKEEITRGQRKAWVIVSGVMTQAGNSAEKLSSAIASSSPVLQMQKPRAGGVPMRHSRMPGFQDQQEPAEFEGAIKALLNQITLPLGKMPVDIPCWLMTDCNVKNLPDADRRIAEIISSYTDRAFMPFQGKGFIALDSWLDNVWRKPALLLNISAVIRDKPHEGGGEALTLTLMLNREHPEYPDAVRLHRPEKNKSASLTKTLSRALLWGPLPPEDVAGSWITGPELALGGKWNTACEENGMTINMTQDHKNIDDFIGYTGSCAPWIAVALAAIFARSGKPQVMAVETVTNGIWIAGVTPGNNAGITQGSL